jgi:2-polyprenyl-3-methyl-5-hydroxy-6-metoxy-1,4-benzoquinol methylase
MPFEALIKAIEKISLNLAVSFLTAIGVQHYYENKKLETIATNMDKNRIIDFVTEVKNGPGLYQTIDFGDDFVAPGKFDTLAEIKKYNLPVDMKGKSYLEIGCNIGATCIEMYRRGANRVVGLDINDEYVGLAQKAAHLVDADIEYHKFDVDKEDIVERFGSFDVVGMFSVIHLSLPIHPQISDPHKILRNVYHATEDLFVTEISHLIQRKYFSWKLWIYSIKKQMLAYKFLQTCKWARVKYLGEGKKDRYVFHCIR